MDSNQNAFYDFEVPDPIRIDKVIKIIKKHKTKPEGLSILECGAVKGGLVDRLKNKNNCFAVDINPRNLDGVIFKLGDLNDALPNFGTKFDVIFAGEVIEHLTNDKKFIKECSEQLKSGGLLILTTPNLVFSVNRILMLFGKMPLFAFAPYHYRIYNKKVLEDALKSQKLNILETKSSHLLFSSRRNGLGKIFEILGDVFPTLGAHLIICAQKP